MATSAEIERIVALTEQLTPLSQRRRGELIEAEDWNTVVSALLEVIRALIADEQSEVPPHDHPDQVSAGWLDPTLRARLERGASSDPGFVARLAAVERGLGGLRLSVDDVRTDLTAVRSMTSRVETADLDRRSSLTRLTRKVDGLNDARDGVTQLRTTLDVLQSDLDRMSAFARDLEVDGEVVSVARMVERLEGLEALRERLTGPNGEELNAASIEVRLAELTATLVTEEELDLALQDRPAGTVPDDLRASLLEDARVAAREQVTTTADALEGRLTARTTARLAEVEESAVAAAAARADELMENVRAEISAELSREISAGDARVREAFEASVLDVRTQLTAQLADQAAELNEGIRARIDEGVNAALPRLTADLQATVERLSSRIGPLDARVGSLQTSVTEVAGLTARLERDLSARTAELAQSLRADLESAVSNAVATMRASDAAITDTLRAEVAAERLRVNTSLDQLRAQVPGIVDGRVSAARADILSTMRGEVAALEAGLDARVGRQVELQVTSEFQRRNIELPNDGRVILRPINPPR